LKEGRGIENGTREIRRVGFPHREKRALKAIAGVPRGERSSRTPRKKIIL